MQKNSIKAGTILAYGAGGISQGLIHHSCVSLIVFFGVASLNLYGSLVGVVCAVAIMITALLEPLVAHMSDHSKSKVLGKRHGAMTLSLFLLATLNIAVFSIEKTLPAYALLLWLGAAFIGMQCASSYFCAPFLALGDELGTNSMEKAYLSRTRRAFLLVGVLIQSLLILLLNNGTSVAEYRSIAVATSCGILLAGLISVLGTYNNIPRLNSSPREPVPLTLFRPFAQGILKNTRGILLGYIASTGSATLYVGLGIFYMRMVLAYQFWTIALVLGLFTFFCAVGYLLFMQRHSKGRLLFNVSIQMLGTLFVCVAFAMHSLWNVSMLGGLISASVIIGLGTGGIMANASGFISKQNPNGRNLDGLCARISVAIVAIITGGVWDLSEFSILTIGYSLCIGGVVFVVLSVIAYAHFFMAVNRNLIELAEKNRADNER